MKYLFAFLFMLLGVTLASVDTHAGPGRPSFSSRPSYGGGFRSSGSSGYRSFSSSPSRTFTFRSTPSYRAPAAARYSAPATSRSTYRSSQKTVVNNQYHNGGSSASGGGLGLMDYVILDNMMSRDRGPAYGSAPVVMSPPAGSSGGVIVPDGGSAVVYQEEGHFWRNVLFILFGVGLLYGIYRLFKEVELVN
ncbi:hypothetical protein [Hymenobacter rubidus]|uniref:hypothetical protein n=1 Tax=Hymenobacter rubidus TaxID=1441626 RepID=UPI00191D6590|nr:hypothetical protein [Hymenobacter rubidus]